MRNWNRFDVEGDQLKLECGIVAMHLARVGVNNDRTKTEALRNA